MGFTGIVNTIVYNTEPIVKGLGHGKLSQFLTLWGWFNIKMPSYQYRKSHCGNKTTIWQPSYLHNGISYTDKTTSLYWIRAQDTYSYTEKTKHRQFTYDKYCLWHLTADVVTQLSITIDMSVTGWGDNGWLSELFLALNMGGLSYPILSRSISWLLMIWWHKEPGHQQPWYSPSDVWKPCKSWPYMRKNFGYFCREIVDEWFKL